MALDLDAVARALAAAIETASIVVNGAVVTASDYVPEAIASSSPPTFVVADFSTSPHQTFNGLDRATFTCRLLIPRGEDAGMTAQRSTRQAASTSGSSSVLAALEAARGAPGQKALSGAADDLVVQRVRGPALLALGEVSFYGVEYTVLVMG